MQAVPYGGYDHTLSSKRPWSNNGGACIDKPFVCIMCY